jgi:HSP20 family protein
MGHRRSLAPRRIARAAIRARIRPILSIGKTFHRNHDKERTKKSMDLVKTNDVDGDLAMLDRMFDSFFDWQLPARRISYVAAPLDLYEKDGKYVLEMSAPGFDPKEIHVEVTGATVTVSGEHTEKTEKRGVKYHRREIRHGSFSRTVTMPQDLDADTVNATIDKGILKVELTPSKPIAPKKIEVKST